MKLAFLFQTPTDRIEVYEWKGRRRRKALGTVKK